MDGEGVSAKRPVVGETVILLHPPLLSALFSVATEGGCLQNKDQAEQDDVRVPTLRLRHQPVLVAWPPSARPSVR